MGGRRISAPHLRFDFDSPTTSNASREGESEPLKTKEDEPSRVVVGSILHPMSEERWRKPNEEHNLKVYTRRQPTSEGRWRKPNEEEVLTLCTRRQSQHQKNAQTNGEIELKGEQHQQQKIPVVVEVDSYECEPCVVDDSLNLPIALRKEP
jgi:hypothetical protein